MTRRRFLASLGFLSAAPYLVQPASARTLNQSFEGDMNIAGATTFLALDLTSSSGRSRIVTGQVWLSGDADDVHGINGRYTRDRKRLSFSAGLPNNQEIRFDGRLSQRGALISGRVMTYANGASVSSGTFSLHEIRLNFEGYS
jgi:hypothetical protein